jgi:hypothetical protein
MDANEFHYLKADLKSAGYGESRRLLLDYAARDYIKNHDCPACEHFGLEPFVFRAPNLPDRHFGRCPQCGEVSDYS